MTKEQAKQLVKKVFDTDFDKERFRRFVKEVLNTLDEEKAFHIRGHVPEIFKPHVKTYERLGTYTDPNGDKLDVLVVYMAKDTSLDRARTAQRNFIARYLKDRDQKDAGLIAFVSPDKKDWRFSFVKMEYRLEQQDEEEVKVKEEFTPARRYSFLVGVHENSHTAQSQLLPLLQDDEHNLTLEQIGERFSIEKVTKEFYDRYKELFLRVQEELDRIKEDSEAVRSDFDEKGVDTADFAKKLLGQIVFLYFLQKKGWFGVERGREWGTGPKNFLRQLFEKVDNHEKNYFNDYLEPLFYDALAVDRSHVDHWVDQFQCRIPFLNGGLFDPLYGYDWVNTQINLPNEIFSNEEKTKEGDVGTGVLDILDRYNFTVREDEPLEKEVAVDPEMLGRVFENLLEVKDRKSKGTYYTPREIVHYMCQESLINYLAMELQGEVKREDIETLIRYGESAVEHDSRVVAKGEETDRYSYKLPKSVRDHAAELDRALASIKVCDPAIGSGAFPVGMMNEIVRTRNALTSYLTDNKTVYDFKREAIQNSLYGVDIDPGAVEIAKLRLWLSLIVDEEDIKEIRPLPNLDYKIMQGNSLLEEFEGIKLFDERLLEKPDTDEDQITEAIKREQSKLQKEYFKLHGEGKLTKKRRAELEEALTKLDHRLKGISREKSKQENGGEVNLSFLDRNNEAQEKFAELKQLHDEFFKAALKTEKDQLRNRIGELEWEFIEVSLKEQGKSSSLKKVEKLKKEKVKPFFLWRLNFAEVFQEKGGFDVVIANPPYLNVELIPKEEKQYYSQKYSTFYKRSDIFGIFLEMALMFLTTERGKATFIIPAQFLNNISYSKLRELMLDNKWLGEVFYVGDKIFKEASNDVCILFLDKQGVKKIKLVNALDFSSRIITEVEVKYFEQFQNVISVVDNLKASTIFDKIFEPENDRIGDHFEIFQGIVTGNNSAFIFENEQKLENEDLEEDLFHTVLLGRDFGKWCIKNRNRKILYIDRHTSIDQYPKIKNWLLGFKSKLEERRECRRGVIPWFSLQWARDKEKLDATPKILLQRTRNPRLKDRIVATIDEEGIYGMESIIFLVPTHSEYSLYYLLGILNSSLLNYLYSTKFLNVAIKAQYLKETPIPKADQTTQGEVESCVRKLLQYQLDVECKDSGGDAIELERVIDQKVYELYGLTEDEIKIVEGKK